MCRYSNKCKYACSKVVCCFSIIVFLLGVAIAVLGAFQMGLMETPIQVIESGLI